MRCSVQLQVTAEPRLALSQAGPLQLLEARDDLGNSLRMALPEMPMMGQATDVLGATCSSVVHIRAPLNRPEAPGRTIKVLRGTVPLRVVARHPDPLVVPLATAAGKSFSSGDIHLLINEVRGDPNTHQWQLELAVREGRTGGLPNADPDSLTELSSRSEAHQQNIEILDSRGHLVTWFQTRTDMESSRMTLTLVAAPGAEPKELRYYRLTETTIDVPFSFSDVPMP